MDFLKRSVAPITDEAWEEIDEQAKTILKGNLSGRKMVDVKGPHGIETAAVNLGHVRVEKEQGSGGVSWGVREVQPLVELRVPFSLNIWELDDVNRGSKTPNLDPVEEAACKAAQFEEEAIYKGLSKACIRGIAEMAEAESVPLPKAAEDFTDVVEDAVVRIQQAGVGGPYSLVLGTEPYQMLMAGDQRGYPLRRRVEDLLGGDVNWSPVLEGGLLLSTRGGDYELTLGQDMAIGYKCHDTRSVELYLTESMTFRVLEPRAAVSLDPS